MADTQPTNDTGVSTDISTDGDPVKVPDSWLWIRDSKGYGSVTVTFITIAFFVTTLAYVLSVVEKIGPVSFRSFDVAACSAYFGTLCALYWGRRYTEAKFIK
jgi:hypothetical protein